MRVVFDTNVLVSALLFKGELGVLSDLIENEICIPCFTPSTFEEFKEVIARERFKTRLSLIGLSADEIIEALQRKSLLYPEVEIEKIIHADPSDNKILACALVSRADFIVSGDKHLLELSAYRDIPIITPAEFLRKIKP